MPTVEWQLNKHEKRTNFFLCRFFDNLCRFFDNPCPDTILNLSEPFSIHFSPFHVQFLFFHHQNFSLNCRQTVDCDHELVHTLLSFCPLCPFTWHWCSNYTTTTTTDIASNMLLTCRKLFNSNVVAANAWRCSKSLFGQFFTKINQESIIIYSRDGPESSGCACGSRVGVPIACGQVTNSSPMAQPLHSVRNSLASNYSLPGPSFRYLGTGVRVQKTPGFF